MPHPDILSQKTLEKSPWLGHPNKTTVILNAPSKIILSICFFCVLATGIGAVARGQVTKFASGDDLEDDFSMIEDDKEKKTFEPKADIVSNESKPKKKQGTKVVNFVG